MSTNDTPDPNARYANRLAHRHHMLRELWRASKSPDIAQAMVTTAHLREEHQTRTGWVADYDGETTTYHYTDPKTRDGVTP